MDEWKPLDGGDDGGGCEGRGLHSLTSQLNLRMFENTSLTSELILNTVGTSSTGQFVLYGGPSKLNLSG